MQLIKMIKMEVFYTKESKVAEDKNETTQALGVITLLDRLWRFNKVMTLGYCFLFLDVFLSYGKGYGVFALSSSKLSDFNLGDICLFLLLFGLISSLGLFFLEGVVFAVLTELKAYRLFPYEGSDKRKKSGYVYIGDLREYAMREQSELAYKEYKEAFGKWYDELVNLHEARRVSFGCLFLFVFGWILSAFNGSKGVFLDGVYSFLDLSMSHFLLGCIVFLVLLVVYLVFYWREVDSSLWVYYPPLYDIKVKEEKKRREREREIEREYEMNKRKLKDKQDW